jgi:hypothetical protein
MDAKTRRVWIGGARWRLLRCRVPDTIWGDCDYSTNTIRVSKALHGEDLLNVLLHEMIHARWPDLSETAVEEFADTLAGILHREGFRQPDDHD